MPNHVARFRFAHVAALYLVSYVSHGMMVTWPSPTPSPSPLSVFHECRHNKSGADNNNTIPDSPSHSRSIVAEIQKPQPPPSEPSSFSTWPGPSFYIDVSIMSLWCYDYYFGTSTCGSGAEYIVVYISGAETFPIALLTALHGSSRPCIESPSDKPQLSTYSVFFKFATQSITFSCRGQQQKPTYMAYL